MGMGMGGDGRWVGREDGTKPSLIYTSFLPSFPFPPLAPCGTDSVVRDNTKKGMKVGIYKRGVFSEERLFSGLTKEENERIKGEERNEDRLRGGWFYTKNKSSPLGWWLE